MRDVTIEIRIPVGQSCRGCKAKQDVTRTSTEYVGHGWERRERIAQRHVCLLYGVALNSHSRRISGTRDPWGHNETAEVFEKCDACLKDSEEYAITGQKGVNHE